VEFAVRNWELGVGWELIGGLAVVRGGGGWGGRVKRGWACGAWGGWGWKGAEG